MGLLVGPMFVVLEMAALPGLFKGLIAHVQLKAQQTHVRDLVHPAH